MKTRIVEYSVGQLAKLAGVSVRTLHHYDEFGLLRPAHVGTNGYRLYGRSEMLRLQEILFYRDAGMSLADIESLLSSPMKAVDRLIAHRERLQEQTRRTAEILVTLETTIAHLKGKRDMELNELYKPFSKEKQAEHERWLVKTYGPDMTELIKVSKRALVSEHPGMAASMTELREIEAQLVQNYENGQKATSHTNHEALGNHRALIARMWGKACDVEGYEGLAQLYLSHPDFVARYEAMSERFSVWFPAAMKSYASHLRSSLSR